ncbi:hypothetical protein ACVJF1_008417 [Bradyrhizobium diazoefficiens]
MSPSYFAVQIERINRECEAARLAGRYPDNAEAAQRADLAHARDVRSAAIEGQREARRFMLAGPPSITALAASTSCARRSTVGPPVAMVVLHLKPKKHLSKMVDSKQS